MKAKYSKGLPIRVVRAVERMEAGGGFVIIEYGDAGKQRYRAVDGKTVSKTVIGYLMDIGRLRSGADGLLEDRPQTLHLVPLQQQQAA